MVLRDASCGLQPGMRSTHLADANCFCARNSTANKSYPPLGTFPMALYPPGLCKADSKCRQLYANWAKSKAFLRCGVAASSAQMLEHCVICVILGGEIIANLQAVRPCSSETGSGRYWPWFPWNHTPQTVASCKVAARHAAIDAEMARSWRWRASNGIGVTSSIKIYTCGRWGRNIKAVISLTRPPTCGFAAVSFAIKCASRRGFSEPKMCPFNVKHSDRSRTRCKESWVRTIHTPSWQA